MLLRHARHRAIIPIFAPCLTPFSTSLPYSHPLPSIYHSRQGTHLLHPAHKIASICLSINLSSTSPLVPYKLDVHIMLSKRSSPSHQLSKNLIDYLVNPSDCNSSSPSAIASLCSQVSAGSVSPISLEDPFPKSTPDMPHKLSSSTSRSADSYWQTVLNDEPYPVSNNAAIPSQRLLAGNDRRTHSVAQTTYHQGTSTASNTLHGLLNTGTTTSHSSASSMQVSNLISLPSVERKVPGSSRSRSRQAGTNRYPPKRFPCSECTTWFRQRSHLNNHFRVVHLKHKPYLCDRCTLAFGKKYDLESHNSAVHDNYRPYSCEHCGRNFAKRSNMSRHIRQIHQGRSKKM